MFLVENFDAETDDVEMAPTAGVVDPLVALANAACRSESRHYIYSTLTRRSLIPTNRIDSSSIRPAEISIKFKRFSIAS